MKSADEPSSEPSIFDMRSLREIHEEIQDVYLSDNRPWVLGYSGGKDSTTTLQLVWYAIAELPPEKRTKPIHVISTNTLVETPVIVDLVDNTIRKIHDKALERKLPFQTHRLRPLIINSFWVNLIGRGYPAPSQRFRWCTDRLKIEPSNRFITEQISKYGEVVLVLGVRSEESAIRAQAINSYLLKNSVLSRHSKFPCAFVYTPIKDWGTTDVWSYLLQVHSPWDNDNRDLVALYRTAQGECPLVIDESTPSCGNSRFGCWVCTVVAEDKSMKALIDSGETWLQPLLDLRNLLSLTQDPNLKPFYRELKRRSGIVSFKSDGSGIITRGPYNLEFRKRLLKMLLEAQKTVNKNNPGPKLELVQIAELHEIRRIWRTQEGDWDDSLPRIYGETMGNDVKWLQDDFAFSSREKLLLTEICRKHDVPIELIIKLFDVELQSQGMTRRSSIWKKLNRVFSEEWRTEEELLKAATNANPQAQRPHE
jgi:DNA sulfur modification protein DndC